jgi:dihydrofolate reductase
MRRLAVFNNLSLDGYIADESGDMSWAHKQDPEWLAFTSENASGEAEMLFGRMTYDLMVGFWPTPQAREAMPDVARAMNETPKVVFSRTLEKAAWQNTRLVKGDLVNEEARKLVSRGRTC